jgi:pimeloyl-ACP methyl ester carboxylesterase
MIALFGQATHHTRTLSAYKPTHNNMPLPVIFFPGTLCDERLWMPCWRKLSITDRRYVPLQWANTLDEMLSITEHTLSSQKAHLIGFSMGGYIASLAAIKWPQHIASLTLISFSSEGLTEQEIKQRHAIVSSIKRKQYKPMGDTRQSLFLSKPNDITEKQVIREEAANTIRAMEADLGPSVLRYHIESTTPRRSLTAQLAKLNCNIQVISGSDDPLVPKAALGKMKKQMTKARFHQIADGGHMLPLENSHTLTQLLATSILQD